MEKVKLPKEIFNLMEKANEYYKEYGKNQVLWSALQSPYADTENKFNALRVFTNKNENAMLIAKAIIFGYEPEETEEERKEREIKEEIKEYLEWRVTNKKDLLYKLTNDLYDIAHGKK